MPIDGLASERGIHQLRMETLGRVPAAIRALPGAAVKAITALVTGDVSQVADLFTQYQDTLESSRSEYLINCVVEDLKWLQGKVDGLTTAQREYLSTDWPSLWMDADKKARATRAKTRIERIAKILCSSIRLQPIPVADETEEMMRIATGLTDEEVLVLKHVGDAQKRYWRLPADALHVLTIPEIPDLKADSVLGICGKLQSMGLIATAQQHSIALKQANYPSGGGFILLDRASAFLKFISSSNVAT